MYSHCVRTCCCNTRNNIKSMSTTSEQMQKTKRGHATTATLFPYTTLFRSGRGRRVPRPAGHHALHDAGAQARRARRRRDRKSTRLNSSHGYISYAVFWLKKKCICTVLARALAKLVVTSKPFALPQNTGTRP